MDAHNIARAYALVARVGRLNPDAGEIGPGMLASLVEDANSIAAEVGNATFVPMNDDQLALVSDGLLFRQLLAASVDPDRLESMAEIMYAIHSAPDYADPASVADLRAEIQNAINQLNERHAS